MDAQCELIIGYLVPHRCERPALGRCRQCNKGFCEEHVDVKPDGLLCHACQGKAVATLDRPLVLTPAYDAADLATFAAASALDTNDQETFADLS